MLKLKELRENKNLSQFELAANLKVSPSTVSNWESGKRQPDMTMVIAIADYFNVSIDYVLGRNAETRLRKDAKSEHTLDSVDVHKLIDKIKKVDEAYYPALDALIDALPNKKSNH